MRECRHRGGYFQYFFRLGIDSRENSLMRQSCERGPLGLGGGVLGVGCVEAVFGYGQRISKKRANIEPNPYSH